MRSIALRSASAVGLWIVAAACATPTDTSSFPAPPPVTIFVNGGTFQHNAVVLFSVTNESAASIQVAPTCADSTQVTASQQSLSGSTWVAVGSDCAGSGTPITIKSGASADGKVTLSATTGVIRLAVSYVSTDGNGIAFSDEFEVR